MAQCIGRIIGKPGDWRAELDFEMERAQVLERGRTGVMLEVCEAPIGMVEPETDDYSASLAPGCEINQRLMRIVFAPEAWATLASIKKDIEARYPNTAEQPGEMPPWAESIVDQIDRTLECLIVPGRDD